MERLGRAVDERCASALLVRRDEAVEDRDRVHGDDHDEADHREVMAGEGQPHQPPLRCDEQLLFSGQLAAAQDLRCGGGGWRGRVHDGLLPPGSRQQSGVCVQKKRSV